MYEPLINRVLQQIIDIISDIALLKISVITEITFANLFKTLCFKCEKMSTKRMILEGNIKAFTKADVFLTPPPRDLEEQFYILLTPGAIEFLVRLITRFENDIDRLYTERLGRKYELQRTRQLPQFPAFSDVARAEWKVTNVSERLRNRHLDLADVSPSDLEHFSGALRADVQGIQVDFDDGHCPTWRNQITGLYNVYRAMRGHLPNVPHISKGPILMFRPRAWNMMEHNMSVNGKEVPGPLFDFALLIYHHAHDLLRHEVGPCFYLSKLEDASEAMLWNNIFTWSEQILEIPYGTIKACVLIENILAVFQMELILYALRDHSLGLNCGIWDYSASIISKLGANKNYLIPDREKYVNMSKCFLKNYMKLVIWICHKRGTYATGGMVAEILPSEDQNTSSAIVHKVYRSKLTEIQMGIDGFLVYDLKLVPHINKLWSDYGESTSQNAVGCTLTVHPEISVADLLTLPVGGVTTKGLMHNISVGILFIFNWLNGKGHFIYKGFVEDSATAEISRSQIWQWIRHGAQLEDPHGAGEIITRRSILECASHTLAEIMERYAKDDAARENILVAFNLFMELINHRNFPEFITSYLNNEHTFRNIHAKL
ncbi:malate synthase-like [Odontomachus brunneus]|uniref:malate synthase-like n=1 Tax=Odontomachus brunneus TaxID=486640 RepID=UPI0013F1A255|nr:malate synthase-like [Odontomachus brunneus]